MRGLNVYCCPNCGHYGFFQLVANAVCPHCSIAMTPHSVSGFHGLRLSTTADPDFQTHD